MSRVLEQREKRARISALLTEKNLDAVILKKGANVAWIIGGRAHIPTTLELSCMDVIVYRDRIVVVTNKIEAPRLQAEELTGDEELIVINWFEGREGQLPKGERIGVDGAENERVNLQTEIETMRRALNDYEVNKLREISKDAADALGEAMLDIDPDMSEVEVAGEIAEELWERNLEPVVLLVAGENRIKNFRHPLPTTDEVGDIAMGVICARRKGLIASVTRIISFSEISSEIQDTYRRLLNVESAFLDGTKVGATFAEAFKSGEVAYLQNGFARDEWTKHHQGGPTGYLPRDYPAHEKTTQIIGLNNAIAWNPSAEGLKVEDTVVTTSAGLEILTVDPNWPTIEIAGRARPALLQR
ncbi:MAG: M24 family metallopeptidase [Candidatus Nanopelagicaceae bacterium]|nr:M24 family metallopeptidase [Candidatus Nanopelagicaceae bacterium]